MFSVKMGLDSSATTTPLVGNQYITTFVSGGGSNFLIGPTEYAYLITDSGGYGISKIDTTGNLVFQEQANIIDANTAVDITGFSPQAINDFYVDNNEYVYTAGSFNGTGGVDGGPAAIQFNSVGQVKGIMAFNPNAISVSEEGYAYGIVGYNSNVYMLTSSGYGNVSAPNAINFLSRFQSNSGSFTYVNQRHLFPATAYLTNISVDTINNTLIVSGTNANTPTAPTQIYTGTFDLTNTSSNNLILVQSSVTTAYVSGPVISDGTYYYQICRRLGSGVLNSYVITKTDKNTGSVLYSYGIKYTGDTYNFDLVGLCLDNAGHIYITGNGDNGVYIGKFNTSNFTNVWQKKISSIYGGYPYRIFTEGNISWSNNYIYFYINYRNPYSPFTTYNSYAKIKDDGSLVDGTYATYYVFTSTSTVTTAINSDSTSTFTYTPTTSSYALYSSNIGITTAPTFYSVSTTVIP